MTQCISRVIHRGVEPLPERAQRAIWEGRPRAGACAEHGRGWAANSRPPSASHFWTDLEVAQRISPRDLKVCPKKESPARNVKKEWAERGELGVGIGCPHPRPYSARAPARRPPLPNRSLGSLGEGCVLRCSGGKWIAIAVGGASAEEAAEVVEHVRCDAGEERDARDLPETADEDLREVLTRFEMGVRQLA